MIPRLKPHLGVEEFGMLFHSPFNAVQLFEEKFSDTFGAKYALAFPYGRSALWSFLNAMEIRGAEIVQPAYTCSVVAHATVLSGNTPVFVDCTLTDYNMDYELFAQAITEKTRVVIPTHLFGSPMDTAKVNEIVHEAEKRFGQRIYVIQDCAHSFEAESNGKSVIHAGDGALFGLGISKQITSIFGGMFTTNDDEIAASLRRWRYRNFEAAGWSRSIKRALYLLAIYPAFNETLYGLVYWLQEQTPILNRLTKAYHLDEKIHFPPDYRVKMSRIEAGVGLAQLSKYLKIKNKRREIAEVYFNELIPPANWVLPPKVKGATYSHFAIRVPDREAIIAYAAGNGVQLGHLIEYSIPHLSPYREYAKTGAFSNSLYCSRHMINLPIHPGLDKPKIEKIISLVNNAEFKQQADPY